MKPPDIDAADAADKLLEAHDGDQDGLLSLEEAEACPGIHKRFSGYDTDGNGQLSSDEIASRFRFWSDDKMGMLTVSCLVTLDGKGLANAVVLFEPEPFFGDALKQAKGKTDKRGLCGISIDPKDLPEELKRIRGVPPGLYRVKIVHPEVSAKYNSETTLGQEVASDVIKPKEIHFKLKRR